jgi:MFS family permease
MNGDPGPPRTLARRPGMPTPDQPCADCLAEAGAPVRRRPTIRRPVAFWIVTCLFAAVMLGTTLPTPLYVIYQARWHFSSGITTVIFASYAVGVLAALLLPGRSSDQVGRRPVLAAALGFSAVSTVVFILSPGVGWLFAGRVLSGLSAGLVMGTATVALTETYSGSSPRYASMVATVANIGGLGLGPLAAGLFAQFGPDPTVLVFEVYLAVLAVAAIGLVFVPETLADRQKLSLRFTGLGIPPAGRSEFVAAGVAGFAAFSLLGMFSALAPNFLDRQPAGARPDPQPGGVHLLRVRVRGAHHPGHRGRRRFAIRGRFPGGPGVRHRARRAQRRVDGGHPQGWQPVAR